MPVFNNYYLDNQRKLGSLPLKVEGPTIPISISIPKKLAEYLSKNGMVVPPPKNGKALIDTGASLSAIDAGALGELGVHPIGYTQVYTPSGSQQQNLFPASVSFPGTNLPTIDYNSVLGSTLVPQGIIALIGRDILYYFLLVYNGQGGHITLAY